jgi:hypothetical protein
VRRLDKTGHVGVNGSVRCGRKNGKIECNCDLGRAMRLRMNVVPSDVSVSHLISPQGRRGLPGVAYFLSHGGLDERIR